MVDDFVPASSLAPIPGTSYSLMIGKVSGKWAVRVCKGREILTTEIIGELDPNIIVTVAQSAIALPSYSPYHIVRAVSPLIREAKTGFIPPPLPQDSLARSFLGTPAQQAQPTQQAQPAQQQPAQQADMVQSVEPIESNEPGKEQDSLLLSQIIGQHVREALASPQTAPSKPPEPTATEVTSKNVPQPRSESPGRSMTAKNLDLKPVNLEELVDRTFSILMRQLETVILYVYNNYGERSAARLWEYIVDVAEMVQAKWKNERFEDFISRRVEEDRVLRVEYQVVEFYEDRFVGRVKKCGLKQSVAEMVKLSGRLSQDLPCMFCESTWKGTCRAMGFQLDYSRDKDGCTIKVQKSASKK